MKLLYKKEKYRHYNNLKVQKQNKKWITNSKKRKNKEFHPKKDINQTVWETIKFPQSLYLSDPKEYIFEKICYAQNLENVNFNFSMVKNISIGSALYIKAYVDSHKEKQNIRISCSVKNKKMREILQHIELKNYNISITHKDILCWTFRSWTKNNPENYGKLMFNEILPKVLKNKVPSEEFSELASNLHELLCNCAEHAYTKNDIFTGYYFIAGEYENKNGKSNKLSFAIIDMGQGFRASLRKNSKFSIVKQKLNIESDEYLLKAAVDGEFNADSKPNSGRGTGLTDVKRNIKKIKGTLNICSDYGYYSYENRECLIHKKNATLGSIITVNLPIN